MAKKNFNSTLFVLMVIMLVNALSYGTIIPLLYPYASKFGINAISLSWLMASFSAAQFLATPVIGRMSDKYGRKPMLLGSLMGTSLSLALFASAWSVPLLFASRILDGITGGNISVAQAVIADSSEGKERSKAMGMLWAAFGFGFLVGPAIGGVLSSWNLSLPFWFASGLALVGVLLGVLIMPETLDKENQKKASKESLFNFGSMVTALFTDGVGVILMVTLLATLAHTTWIIGFQTFTVDVLRLDTVKIGLLFAGAGLMSILMQGFGLRWLVYKFESEKLLLLAGLGIASLMLAGFTLSGSLKTFSIGVFGYMIGFSLIQPMITSLLSQMTNSEDQGAVLGINQSYMSLGQILGPLIAGLVVSKSVYWVFAVAAVIMMCTWVISGLRLRRKVASYDWK